MQKELSFLSGKVNELKEFLKAVNKLRDYMRSIHAVEVSLQVI